MNNIEIFECNPKHLSADRRFDFRLGCDQDGSLESNGARDTGMTPPTGVPAGPPALLKTDTSHVVIHGHRQIEAALSKGIESISSIVYPAATPKQTVVALALEQCQIRGSNGNSVDNKPSSDTLSGIEKILAVYKTSLYAAGDLAAIDEPLKMDKPVSPPDWIIPLYTASILGRRFSKQYLARICSALTLPKNELLALGRFRFSVDQIASILVLSPKERAAVLTLRDAAAFSTSDIRQLVRLLILSRGRANFEIDTWAETAARNLDSGSAVTRSIEMEIYPTLTNRRRRVEETIEELRLPNRLRIKPPENLEGDSFSCYFRFSQIEELAGYLELLGRAVQDGNAGRLLDLLNDEVANTEEK